MPAPAPAQLGEPPVVASRKRPAVMAPMFDQYESDSEDEQRRKREVAQLKRTAKVAAELEKRAAVEKIEARISELCDSQSQPVKTVALRGIRARYDKGMVSGEDTRALTLPAEDLPPPVAMPLDLERILCSLVDVRAQAMRTFSRAPDPDATEESRREFRAIENVVYAHGGAVLMRYAETVAKYNTVLADMKGMTEMYSELAAVEEASFMRRHVFARDVVATHKVLRVVARTWWLSKCLGAREQSA